MDEDERNKREDIGRILCDWINNQRPEEEMIDNLLHSRISVKDAALIESVWNDIQRGMDIIRAHLSPPKTNSN